MTDLPWDEIALTPLEDGDIDDLHDWQNDPSIRDLTMGFRFPVQKEAVRDWLKGLREQNGRTRIVYAIRRRGQIAGTIQLDHIEPFQRKAMLGIVIGRSGDRKSGTGTVAVSLLLDFAFSGMDLRRIGLEVIATNATAIRLYERLGFVREGTRRQDYLADGRYIDTHLYGMLREEFALVIPPAAHRLCG